MAIPRFAASGQSYFQWVPHDKWHLRNYAVSQESGHRGSPRQKKNRTEFLCCT